MAGSLKSGSSSINSWISLRNSSSGSEGKGVGEGESFTRITVESDPTDRGEEDGEHTGE